MLLVSACAPGGGASPAFVVEHAWAGRGERIAADLHVHTRFSDGAHTVDQLVDRAVRHGCRALAIADHADRGLGAATPAWQAAIESARADRPDLVLLAGLEWNIPPAGGDEHATVLVPPGPQHWTTLGVFKDRFDDYDLGDRAKPDARAALEWLASTATDAGRPVVIYNHPSRKDDASIGNAADLESWRAINDIVVGFEGAPGHQGDDPIGSYAYTEKTIDRWDPAAARIGDAWDRLLQRGIDVHGALAGSDFHTANPGALNDRWPCEFSETWLEVPEPTPAGVLRALRAGTFVGVHGRIVRDVELTAAIDGLPRAARPGEAVVVPAGSAAAVTLTFVVPELDWEGKPNRIDEVELIVVSAGGATSRRLQVGGAGRPSVSETVVVEAPGIAIRARGRRTIDDGPDLMFYTNAIRIRAGR
jgi:hypothetical protein